MAAAVDLFFPPPFSPSPPSTSALPSWKCGRQVVAFTTWVTPLARSVLRQRAEATPPTKRGTEGWTRARSRGGGAEGEEEEVNGDDEEEPSIAFPPSSSVPSLARSAAMRAAATTRSASARVPQGPRGGCCEGGEASHIFFLCFFFLKGRGSRFFF